jgi:multidrug efflux pump subunit AcrB
MSFFDPKKQVGAIAWMAKHSVAANLAMIFCLIGGFLALGQMRQEVFPEFEVDVVNVSVTYPGASPEEIESGILLVIEDVVGQLDGVDDVSSTAKEGVGTVSVYGSFDIDSQRLAQDVQKGVDRISTFPKDADKPQISIINKQQTVVSVVIFGQAKDRVLHELAEQFRDRLLQDPDISHVELAGVKPLEISIEVPQENLRRYGLSLGDIAEKLTNANVDLPAGSIKTNSSEILIRTKERRDFGHQYSQLPVITTGDGSILPLGDIAKITDGYDQSDYYATYNGKPAVLIDIASNQAQTPLHISSLVNDYVSRFASELPEGVAVEVRRDASTEYGQRIGLLVSNSILGLILVFMLLSLFLELRLAFWVMMGIPISFLGSFLILQGLGVSLNMISLFAFIIVLGIVVDDAIVVGENIYRYRQQGFSPMQAAIEGAKEIALPVTYSILTNIATFVPLLFIPGFIGKIFVVIPVVVITVFMVSLLESLFILPNHLAQIDLEPKQGLLGLIHLCQQRFSQAFTSWVRCSYSPFLTLILRYRYLTTVIALCMLIATLSYAVSGRMGMTLFPKTEADFAQVSVTMPFGTPMAQTEIVVRKLVEAAQRAAAKIPEGDKLLSGLFAELGTDHNRAMGSHLALIRAYLAPPELRNKILGTDGFVNLWREETDAIPGLESILFESDAGGPGSDTAITVELNHRDIKVLQIAGEELAAALAAYPMVHDVNDGFSSGKEQLDLKVLPEGKSLGFTAQTIARQIRDAYYGAEVIRQQRGRNELKVMVRLPKDERMTEQNLDNLILWTPSGREVPLDDVVEIQRGRAYTEINRRNGRRIIQVKADVSPKSKAGEIINDLVVTELPRLQMKYPGLRYSFEGSQADMRESLSSLKMGFVFAVLVVYALLALPFHSYLLPLVVIFSIPFGVIGAIFGHLMMGFDLSILSTLGIVALSGIAVNDALVLIEYATQLRLNQACSALKAIKKACLQRFRPVILTTVTTFCGLMPMIFESSRQARMLVPMAISIGFGILFATLITLLLIPALYLIVEDVKNLLKPKK